MNLQRTFSLVLLLLAVIAPRAEAGVLAEDRSDILSHLYEGGGIPGTELHCDTFTVRVIL